MAHMVVSLCGWRPLPVPAPKHSEALIGPIVLGFLKPAGAFGKAHPAPKTLTAQLSRCYTSTRLFFSGVHKKRESRCFFFFLSGFPLQPANMEYPQQKHPTWSHIGCSLVSMNFRTTTQFRLPPMPNTTTFFHVEATMVDTTSIQIEYVKLSTTPAS